MRTLVGGLAAELAGARSEPAVYENCNTPSSPLSLFNAERDEFRKGAAREGRRAIRASSGAAYGPRRRLALT